MIAPLAASDRRMVTSTQRVEGIMANEELGFKVSDMGEPWVVAHWGESLR